MTLNIISIVAFTIYSSKMPKLQTLSFHLFSQHIGPKGHFHFTLSLRAHGLQNQISISHGMAFEWFQRTLDFHGHSSWSMCKAVITFSKLNILSNCSKLPDNQKIETNKRQSTTSNRDHINMQCKAPSGKREFPYMIVPE